MNRIIKRTCLASALCAVCGALFIAAPTASRAQDTPPPANDTAGKQINLDLESSNLYYGLKLLFSQVKANFTIDESLKSLTVTAHFVNVPFRVALESLLKSTGAPLTYKVENGIYSVVPKVETAAEPTDGQSPVEPGDPASGQDKLGIIHTNNVSALDIVQALGGVIVSVGYNSYGFGRLNGNGGLGQGGLGMGGFGQGGFGNNGNGNNGSGNGVGNGFGNYGTGNPAGFNNGRNQGSGNGVGRGF